MPLTIIEYSSIVALSTRAPSVRVASLKNSPRAFERPISCWFESSYNGLQAKTHQTAGSLDGTIFTTMFKLFHARWADRQRVWLHELIAVHQHDGHDELLHLRNSTRRLSRRLFKSRSSPGYASGVLIDGLCVLCGCGSRHLEFASARLLPNGELERASLYVSGKMRDTICSFPQSSHVVDSFQCHHVSRRRSKSSVSCFSFPSVRNHHMSSLNSDV